MLTAPVGCAVGLGVAVSPDDAGGPEAGDGTGVASGVGTETIGSGVVDVDAAPGLAVSDGTGAAAISAVPAP
jgi:hypothetical protein